MKTWDVEEPVLKTATLFIVGCEWHQVQSYFEKHFNVQLGDRHIDLQTIGTTMTFDHHPWRFVWLKEWPNLSTLVHEIFHLVTRICSDRGIPIRAHLSTGENGDECAAYLFEFFFTECLKQHETSTGERAQRAHGAKKAIPVRAADSR